MSIVATCLGYPRIGPARELKRSLEAFWAGECTSRELDHAAGEFRRRNWQHLSRSGIDHVPSNDFSLYDHVLDAAVAVGAVPERYARIEDPLVRYFAMARGLHDRESGVNVAALGMTKWFDTNYHYIVPEIAPEQRFVLEPSKILTELEDARALGIETRPVVLGPVTFLRLSKCSANADPAPSPIDLVDALLPVYEALFATLANAQVSWVQLDEPSLVLDLDDRTRAAYARALPRLAACEPRPRLLLTTYFGALENNMTLATSSGFDGLHVDLVRAPEQLNAVLESLGRTAVLSAGVVDGRNVWRTDLDVAHQMVRRAVETLGTERVFVAPSCSLLHVPLDLDEEGKLDPELVSWLAFASQKLDELRVLADAAGAQPTGAPFERARAAITTRQASRRIRNEQVRARAETVAPPMLRRGAPYERRVHEQRRRLRLPMLPTTTIGSFPQTTAIRRARAAWRGGQLTTVEYDGVLREELRRCVEKQEALGIDVLVHGEYERSDMVEYFAERLDGFACTENGWVQSYGSRCVRPPILFGDVSRPRPMTVEWLTYAQSLTIKPVKGMLTGPVTLLQWSFVRDDRPRSATCRQVALALRDEVEELERAGLAIIQIDEPALREGLPLRHRNWGSYLRSAVEAFRIATSAVRDDTQVQTHMCYSDFGDVIDAIVDMDADVLLIEASRSRMELLPTFARSRYPNDIGPGIYDVHSPRVPTTDEMVNLLLLAARVVPPRRLWVNPDCGLKTRHWPEVEAALGNMVEAARRVRARFEDHGDATQRSGET